MTEVESGNIPAQKLYEACGLISVSNPDWEGATYQLDLVHNLTPGQRRFLASLPAEKLNRIVCIKPLNSETFKMAQKMIEDIRHAVPGLEVELGGSLALKIVGEEDIDISIYCPTKEQHARLDGLQVLFGEGQKVSDALHTWGFEREGIHVGIWLVDPERSPVAKETQLLQELFREKPELVKEYEQMKKSMDGKTYKEYQTAKYEFYNKALKDKNN